MCKLVECCHCIDTATDFNAMQALNLASRAALLNQRLLINLCNGENDVQLQRNIDYCELDKGFWKKITL